MKSSEYSIDIVKEAEEVALAQSRFIASRGNPQNARRWRDKFFAELEEIRNFPHKFPVYYDRFERPTPYRKVVVQNFLVFYYVDQQLLKVTVTLIEPGELHIEHP